MSRILETTGKEQETNNNEIELPNECLEAFYKAMKIGYYKEFLKRGLISQEQFDLLMKIQDHPELIKDLIA